MQGGLENEICTRSRELTMRRSDEHGDYTERESAGTTRANCTGRGGETQVKSIQPREREPPANPSPAHTHTSPCGIPLKKLLPLLLCFGCDWVGAIISIVPVSLGISPPSPSPTGGMGGAEGELAPRERVRKSDEPVVVVAAGPLGEEGRRSDSMRVWKSVASL